MEDNLDPVRFPRYGFIRPVVGDLYVPRTIIAGGNRPFKPDVVERVICYGDGKPFLTGVFREAFWHRPALQDAVFLEPEIKMVVLCKVFVQNKPGF